MTSATIMDRLLERKPSGSGGLMPTTSKPKSSKQPGYLPMLCYLTIVALALIMVLYYGFYVRDTLSRITAYQLLHEEHLQQDLHSHRPHQLHGLQSQLRHQQQRQPHRMPYQVEVHQPQHHTHPLQRRYEQQAQQEPTKTLVMYIFANADPQYLTNLQYFVEHGVVESEEVDYIIVVQDSASKEDIQLPDLPGNAQYISHKNECYDWGTFGWLLLQSGEVNYAMYKYFVFLNSSVKGPFMPAYLWDEMHWTEAFTGSLTDTVKLVGPTISCVGVPFAANSSNEWRKVAHVQSYAMATDQKGLQILINDGKVFKCHAGRWDAIWYSELGSSLAVLQAGYNIGSFLVRYQGIDFRDNGTWTCNDGMASAGVDNLYDGISADPMEVMFIKVKQFLLRDGASAATASVKYEHWQGDAEQGRSAAARNISSNEYSSKLRLFLLTKVLEMSSLGEGCFDTKLYQTANSKLLHVPRAPHKAWRHFILEGQFMPQLKFQFNCSNASAIIANLTGHMAKVAHSYSPSPPPSPPSPPPRPLPPGSNATKAGSNVTEAASSVTKAGGAAEKAVPQRQAPAQAQAQAQQQVQAHVQAQVHAEQQAAAHTQEQAKQQEQAQAQVKAQALQQQAQARAQQQGQAQAQAAQQQQQQQQQQAKV